MQVTTLEKNVQKSKEKRKSHYFEAAGTDKDKPEALDGCREECRAL